MPSILNAFNLFSYNKFWRIQGEGQATNNCGGVVTVMLLMFIFAVLINQLVTVFRMQKMTSTSSTLVNSLPSATTMSTFQQNQTYQPFMFALDIYGGNMGTNVNLSTLNIFSYTQTLNGSFGQWEAEDKLFTLQPCTPYHFSAMNEYQTFFDAWNVQSWLCLPINNTFNIQGAHPTNRLFSNINLFFDCSGQCLTNFTDLNIWLYTLSTTINPTNSSSPFSYYLTQATIPIQYHTEYYYSYNLNENIVITDSSLLPFESLSTARSIQAGSFQAEQIYNFGPNNFEGSTSTLVYFQRSTQTIQYKRSYLKILDGLSYVGGIFQVVIGVFFFMEVYARYTFEFRFATNYLKTAIVKDYGFLSFIKFIIYNILTKMNCKPAWPVIESQIKLRETVNNLLDVVYLQKRIEFLERAITVALQQHQLKGLYLYPRLSKEKANRKFRDHKLRDRLIYFLNLKKENSQLLFYNQKEEELKNSYEGKEIKKSYKSQNVGIINKQSLSKKGVKQSLPKKGEGIEIELKLSKQMSKESSSKSMLIEEMKERQSLRQSPHKSMLIEEMNQKQSLMQSFHKINFLEDLKHEKPLIQSNINIVIEEQLQPQKCEMKQNTQMWLSEGMKPKTQIPLQKQQQKKMDYQYYLKQEVKQLQDFDSEDLNERQLIYELATDIKKLVREAEAPDGDSRSKRIYKSIDGWLRQEIKAFVEHQKPHLYAGQLICMQANLQ